MLNPLDNQRLVISRDSMNVVFEELNRTQVLDIRCPNGVIVSEGDDVEVVLSEFRFPAICKTIRVWEIDLNVN